MMNYTQNFNLKPQNNQENESMLSFSFSLTEPEKTSIGELLKTVNKHLQDILNNRFNEWEKRKILPKHGRLNFACPYCGDSHQTDHKKRGNIYTETGFFKCYNCGKGRSLEGFLKDFKKFLTTEELLLAREINESGKIERKPIDPMMLYDVDSLNKWSIERSTIEETFNLIPLDKTKIFIYLKKRLQPDLTKFSWNGDRQQLYIFNMIPNTTRVLGYQIRNFRSTPKYLTFKLSRIYEELNLDYGPEVEELDDISTTFGILGMDISKPVTVFEGPLDSFLYRNSIATCSSNIDSPIETTTLRYLYDFDKAGREAALKKLNAGGTVFLWKKFFNEAGLDEPLKKMDLTDLVVMAKRKGLKIPRISDYFSNDKYDSYWI
jgi:hypothetical protein